MSIKKILILAVAAVFLPHIALANAMSDNSQDAICLALIQSFADKDPEQFIKTWFPTMNEYFEAEGRSKVKQSEDYYTKANDQNKESFLKSWQSVVAGKDGVKIVWQDAEYLRSVSNRSRNYSKIRFIFRYDHVNYLITLGTAHYLHEKWVYFDRKIKLEELKPPGNPTEKAADSLANELGFSTAIPAKGFKAIFYDKKTHEIKHEMDLDKIQVDLGNKELTGFDAYATDFHGIEPNNISAYVVGNLYFPEDTMQDITINQSNSSKFSVQLDGNTIKRQQLKNYQFTKGKHLVEVRYEAGLPLRVDWVKFSVRFTPPVTDYSVKELKKALEPEILENTKIWYVGLYESDEKYQRAELELEFSLDPVILFIGTYKVSSIDIRNIRAANVSAIVISSMYPPITVDFSGKAADIPVYHSAPFHSVPCVHKMEPKLHRTGNNEIYDENQLTQLVQYIKEVTGGKRINGYSTAYSAKKLIVPDQVLSAKEYLQLIDVIEKGHKELMRWK
jgi:hypothetical protein